VYTAKLDGDVKPRRYPNPYLTEIDPKKLESRAARFGMDGVGESPLTRKKFPLPSDEELLEFYMLSVADCFILTNVEWVFD